MKVLVKAVAAGAIGCAGLFPTSASANPALPVLPDTGVLPLPDDLLPLPGLLSPQPAAGAQSGTRVHQGYGAGAGAGRRGRGRTPAARSSRPRGATPTADRGR